MATTSQPLSSRFLFLPAEIRHKIYTFLFIDTALQLSLSTQPHDHNLQTDTTDPSVIAVPSTIEHITPILLTNHFIRNEALPIFEKHAWRRLVILGNKDPNVRLPSLFTFSDVMEAPQYQSFSLTVRFRVRQMSMPWLEKLEGEIHWWYLRRAVPNLESIEIVLRTVLVDSSPFSKSGPLIKSLFDVTNAGDGLIGSVLPLEAIRVLRTEGNIFDRVRVRVRSSVKCEDGLSNPVNRGNHDLLLECVIDSKTLELVKYSALEFEDLRDCRSRDDTTMTPYRRCSCTLGIVAARYVGEA